MEKLKQHLSDQTEVGNDVRVEALVSVLAELNDLGSEVLLRPNGGFARNYSKDIEQIIGSYGNQLQLAQNIVELNRKGIFDGLPEGLFHQSESSKPFRSITEIKDLITKNKEQEEDARKFFWPFDHELISMSTAIEFNEKNQIANVLSTAQNNGLKKFWSVPSFLAGNTQGKLLMLLPLSNRISSKLSLIQDAFEILLEMPVEIEKSFEVVKSKLENAPQRMEDFVLGVNSILGNTIHITQAILTIRIGPIGQKEAGRFAPGEYNWKKLNCLIDYFVPCTFYCKHEIVVFEDEKKAVLETEGSRIGITTYLN